MEQNLLENGDEPVVEEIDWGQYEEIEGPKPGEIRKAKITAIKESTWRQEISADKIHKFKDRADAKIANMTLQLEDGKIIPQNIELPDDKRITPRSKIGQFKERYGGFPKTGMEVNVQANREGYYDLIL